MNVRQILSGVAGLIMIAAPLVVATGAAADPYNTPDDVAAYQAYTGQRQYSQYPQPMPPPGQYPPSAMPRAISWRRNSTTPRRSTIARSTQEISAPLSTNLVPEIGITGTPVISLANQAL
jgi:hypothetical protein